MSLFTQVLLIFLALLAAAAIGYSVYRARCRRRAEKANDPRLSLVPAVLRGGRILAVCLVGACILSLLLWSFHLQNRVEKLEQSLVLAMNSLSHDLDSNYRLLRWQVMRQSEVFESVEWEFVDLDPDSGLLDIRFTAVPKVYSEETVIRVLAKPAEQVLARQSDGSYTGILQVDLHSEWTESICLSLTSPGVIQYQDLDFRLTDIRGSFLPSVSCTATCDTEGEKTTSVSGLVTVSTERYAVSSLTVELSDGVQALASEKFPETELNASAYQTFEYRLDLPEPLEQGGWRTLRLIFVDSLGLRHEADALLIVGGEPFGLRNSDLEDKAYPFYLQESEVISNADGMVLFRFSNGVG